MVFGLPLIAPILMPRSGRTSLSTVGTLRHPISVTSAHLGIPPYPAWGAEHNISLSKEEIEDISLDLQQKFGFQRDYAVHADYIGGSLHITASGSLLPSWISTMLFVIILKTQCPGTLASGNEQHVPVRPYASDCPLVLSPLLDGIIGYDDVNQLFWYPERIARTVLSDKTRLVDIPPAQRYMHSERIDWNCTLFKTYYEKRSFGHLLINFSYILVLWHPAAQHVLTSIVGEHTVKLWDLGTPKSPCAVLTGHGDRIQRLAFIRRTITCNNLPQLQLRLFDPHTGGEATRVTEGRVASRAQMWSGSETGRIAATGFLESSKEV
ncbi:hypothetical protein BGY98DRAFT_934513 [Russula aff. rugulosa BPL654]|nr:hypothetical protein BGY98DRAFT_934513 [Russula aff. rugulosa BPL654]